VSAARRAWLLNLDAERELEARQNYAPTLHVLGIIERESPRLLGTLVAPGDVVLTERDFIHQTEAARAARGLPGVAWCPTRRATAMLAAAGATPMPAPAMEVLRTVNARPFAARLRASFRAGSFDKHVATSLDEALAQLALPAGHGWLVRRTFGAAGRGRRRIAAGCLAEDERRWIEASLRRGPLVIEPWVEIEREYTRSGWVHDGGEVSISRPCFQQTTRHGAWTRTACADAGEVPRADDECLAQTMSVVGAALSQAGYFGPFGIDAFRHRALDGTHRTVLNPLSEINARFTMDWATAFAADPARGIAHQRVASLLGHG
jgi:hypothetical protein